MKHFASALALLAIGGLAMGLAPVPANAKVAQVAANGFVIRHLVEVPSSVEETWAVLVKPAVWWDADHTWSGNAANLTLDARAGGCFCEILPDKASPKAPPRGSVEHMRVIYVERPRALRMVGALGPLQADAANATLTIQLKAGAKGGTQVLLEYVVGGFTRTPFETLAPAVDAMLAAQLRSLTGKLGGSFAAAFPGPEAGPPASAEVEAPSSPPTAGEPPAGPEAAEGAETESDQGVVPLSDAPPSSDGTIVGR
jgi:hypothetical protein